MMMKLVVLALLSSLASAYVVAPKTARPSTQLHESFGFGFAEDSYENQPDELRGETAYKEFVNKFSDNAFVNRQVSLFLLALHLM